jgi:hypothetical protein
VHESGPSLERPRKALSHPPLAARALPRSSRTEGGYLPPAHFDPANIPHDDEKRGVATEGNPEPK